MRDKIIIGTVGSLLLLAALSCRVGSVESQLSPRDEQFLSQVRYIITKEERQAFIKLPEAERPQFIEEFWRRRDPDEHTPENEFKEEYFNLMGKANELFLGEGREGWLTDRGRIYILFGPPSQRSTTPAMGDSSGRCREIWHYGNFPVLFEDKDCSGVFVLGTFNLEHLSDLSMAQAAARKAAGPRPEQSSFDFSLSLKKKSLDDKMFEGMVVVEIPYDSIWFGAEGDRLKTTYELQMELRDSQDVIRWEHNRRYDLALTVEQLEKYRGTSYTINVPLIIRKEVAALRQGKNKLRIVLRNTTGKEEARKVAEFSL
jgi:GWxTD domain-containing protein